MNLPDIQPVLVRGAGAVGQAELFPLPLVPFEHYMVADDRAGYPMTFPVRVELEGEPNRKAMDAALDDAIQRHPLLSSRLTRRGTRLYWEPGTEPTRIEWTTSDGQSDSLPGQAIDLTRSPGVRLVADVRPGHSTFSFLFHHAACDGIGAFRFIGDVMAFYARRTAAEDMQPRLLPIEPANLRYRGQFDIRLPRAISPGEVLRSTLREGWKALSRRPRPLMNRNRPRPPRPSRLHVQSLDETVYRRFCRRASEAGVTANDLLMRDMFLTMFQWNGTRAPRRSRGWLRITMPTSLRGKRDSRMPATNVLGYAFVTRHTDQCTSSPELLSGLAAETETIRAWSMGALFVEALRKVERIPGLLAAGVRLSRRFSTVVLSNLGDPTRRFRARFPSDGGLTTAGDLRIREIYGAPPVRPGTRAALAVSSYAGHLTMAMMVDPKWFSEEDAVAFLSQYRERLLQSAEGVS